MPLLQSAAQLLVRIGFVDVILPFILTFTVVYGILQQRHVLSKEKNVNAMVGVVISLFVVASIQVVGNLFAIITWASIVFLAVFLGFLVMGLTGIEIKKSTWYWHVAWVIGFALILAIAAATFHLSGNVRSFLTSRFIQTLVVAVLLVHAVVFIVRDKKSSTPTAARPTTRSAARPAAARP